MTMNRNRNRPDKHPFSLSALVASKLWRLAACGCVAALVAAGTGCQGDAGADVAPDSWGSVKARLAPLQDASANATQVKATHDSTTYCFSGESADDLRSWECGGYPTAAKAVADPFNITLDYTPTAFTGQFGGGPAFAPADTAAINRAARRWEAVVVGGFPDTLGTDDLLVEVYASARPHRPTSEGWHSPHDIHRGTQVSFFGMVSFVHRAGDDYMGTDRMYQVALHELGHALGLDHRTEKGGVMHITDWFYTDTITRAEGEALVAMGHTVDWDALD